MKVLSAIAIVVSTIAASVSIHLPAEANCNFASRNNPGCSSGATPSNINVYKSRTYSFGGGTSYQRAQPNGGTKWTNPATRNNPW